MLMHLGPHAAPTLPDLRRLADRGGRIRFKRAVRAMSHIGPEGFQAISAIVAAPNPTWRAHTAIAFLRPGLADPAVRTTLNALKWSDPFLSSTAAMMLRYAPAHH